VNVTRADDEHGDSDDHISVHSVEVVRVVRGMNVKNDEHGWHGSLSVRTAHYLLTAEPELYVLVRALLAYVVPAIRNEEHEDAAHS
jgi:hypothetical protein